MRLFLSNMRASRVAFVPPFSMYGVLITATGTPVMRSMVANGFGYGIANMRPLNTMSPDGKLLVFVPLLGDIRPLTMGIALPNAEHRTLTVQAFIDHCRRFVVEQGVFGTERIVK